MQAQVTPRRGKDKLVVWFGGVSGGQSVGEEGLTAMGGRLSPGKCSRYSVESAGLNCQFLCKVVVSAQRRGEGR
jgi:hypothetical protein